MRPYLDQMLHGPGSMRFILQPLVASVIGLLHGLRGRKSGLGGIAVPLLIALGASLIFQYVIRSQARLLPAVAYALVFVALPYFAVRELAARMHHHPRRAA